MIRAEIERLFNNNTLKYLVCTSTLIEGVNLPCKNIFIRGPKKGKRGVMNQSDFWNLAGRAGRLRKEFQGNIICIDAQDQNVWKNGAPKKRERYLIKRATDQILFDADILFKFIKDRAPREQAIASPELESVFSFLVSSYLFSDSIKERPWARRFPDTFINELEILIKGACQELKTPKEVIQRNPGISPFAMDSLLEYFARRTKPLEELIPALPESSDAYQSYLSIFHRINNHFGMIFSSHKRAKQLTLIVLHWMRGYSLARIIQERIKFYGTSTKFKIATEIRNAMVDVEQYARFQAPKFIACYIDLLQVFLKQINKEDLLKNLPNLNVLLEFGVSQKTQLSLIGLGLTRTSAIELSELIAKDNMTEEECIEWIKNHEWAINELPNLIIKEIESLMKLKYL